MTVLRLKRRSTRLVCILALLIGILPAGAAMAAHGEDNPHIQDITFTLVTTDVLEDGESWETDTTFSIRNSVTAETVAGDLTGSAVITMSGNFVAAGECTDDSCPGYTDSWSDLTITDENGTWDGQMAFQIDDLEESMLGKVFLIGRGGNSGMAIYGDMEFLETEDSAAQITGHILTLLNPSQGVRLLYDGCFVPPAGTAGNVRMTVGSSTDFGAWDANYPLLIPGYATVGESIITSPNGTVDSVLMLQNAGASRVGYFMLMGGSGEYENLYGFGIVRTAAYDNAGCGDAGGAGGHWIGRAYAN